MTRIKSLAHNLKDGVDIKRHRTHRSKKGRNCRTDFTHARLYKKKLEDIKLRELEDEIISSSGTNYR